MAHGRRERGASLLEAIGVVALSGGLAAAVLPRATELATDARIAVVAGLHGALRSAVTMAHLKCAVDPACDPARGSSTVAVFGESLRIVRGYPAVVPAGGDPVGVAATLDAPGFTPREAGAGLAFAKDDAPDAARCAVVYREPERDGAAPSIVSITSGC